MRTVSMLKFFRNKSVGMIALVVTMTVAIQRPDSLRHESSRLNRSFRFQNTEAEVLFSRHLRSTNPATETDSWTPTSASPSPDMILPSGYHRHGRQPRFVPQSKVVRMAVLAPKDPEHQFSLLKILPAIHLAARTIERDSDNVNGRSKGPLPGWKIQIVNRDSNCSSIYGPLEAIELHKSKSIGPTL